MKDFSEKLSAYMDGELSLNDASGVETLLANDPDAQAILDALMLADALAIEQFQTQLNDPVPFALAQDIKAAEISGPFAPHRPIWGTLAASLVVFAMGGAGGYAINGQSAPAPDRWLADIADYHAIYASQDRHLVEVGADRASYIEAWLGNTVGTTFTIPDLSSFGMTFEGGRLLVANGKPVAQLMYRQPNGAVIALCLQRSNTAPGETLEFKTQTINGFDFVSWTTDGADYVVIGPGGQPDLGAIATNAALGI